MKRTLARVLLFALGEARWWSRGGIGPGSHPDHPFIFRVLTIVVSGAGGPMIAALTLHRGEDPSLRGFINACLITIAGVWCFHTVGYLISRVPVLFQHTETKLQEIASAPSIETPKAGRLSIKEEP